MIDGLMDSLVLDKLPTRELLQQTLDELCRGAEDFDPILHSFRTTSSFASACADILSREDVQATTGALSDIAQTCLAQIAAREYERLVVKFAHRKLPKAAAPAIRAKE